MYSYNRVNLIIVDTARKGRDPSRHAKLEQLVREQR